MNEDLHFGEEGFNLLKSTEKFVGTAYKPTPTDKWTYGYGATIKADGTPVVEGDEISLDDAELLLLSQLIPRENKVKSRISFELNQNQFDSLVDLVYNAGVGYRDKQGTYHDWELFTRLNNGQTGDELRVYWESLAITQGGVKLNGLITRRKKEVEKDGNNEVVEKDSKEEITIKNDNAVVSAESNQISTETHQD